MKNMIASGMFRVHSVPDGGKCGLISFNKLLGFKEFIPTEAVT
jgi:hypothetical protein